jgi:hypothetical protein
MLTAQMKDRLAMIGVAVFSEDELSADVWTIQVKAWPTVALWRESEQPTDREMELLESLVKETGGTLADDFKVQAFVTMIFYKKDGLWTWRRLMWAKDPLWHSCSGTLLDILTKVRAGV